MFPPRFHESTLHQGTCFHKVEIHNKYCTPSEDEIAWRTLKFHMNKIHNREKEQEYFGYEMMCKALNAKEESFSAYLLIGLYGISSDYGRSIIRPLLAIMWLWLCYCIVYASCPNVSWEKALELSLAGALPFLGLMKHHVKDMGFLGTLVLSSQVILSGLFIFLTGLGLRNRFLMR